MKSTALHEPCFKQGYYNYLCICINCLSSSLYKLSVFYTGNCLFCIITLVNDWQMNDIYLICREWRNGWGIRWINREKEYIKVMWPQEDSVFLLWSLLWIPFNIPMNPILQPTLLTKFEKQILSRQNVSLTLIGIVIREICP